MYVSGILFALLLSMLPVFELRAGIPLAVASGLYVFTPFLLCTVANILIIPFILLFLEYINHFFLRIKGYKIIFDKMILKKRAFIAKHIKPEFEYVGLLIFVAVPVPGTGAYSGALLAWLLGLHKKSFLKTVLILSAGVIIAGIIIAVAISGIMTLPSLLS